MKTILFDLKQSGVIAYAKLSSQTYAIPVILAIKEPAELMMSNALL